MTSWVSQYPGAAAVSVVHPAVEDGSSVRALAAAVGSSTHGVVQLLPGRAR